MYRDIHQKLIEPFPEGTLVSKEDDDYRRYIPVQPYIHRLEEAAGVYWSWRITGDPVIYREERQVMVRGILKIVETEREGIGFAHFQTFQDTGKIKNLKYAITSAASDALRDACDKFEMGWVDLAPYRSWGENPGIGQAAFHAHQSKGTGSTSTSTAGPKCIKCQIDLTTQDIEILKNHNIKHNYCSEHIPAHLRK